MKIVFDIDLEDIEAAYKAGTDNNLNFTIAKLMQSISGPAFLYFIIHTATLASEHQLIIRSVSLLACVPLGLALWKYSPGLILSASHQSKVRDGHYENMLGRWDISINDEYVAITNKSSESKSKLNLIDLLQYDDKYIFMRLSKSGIVTIPKNKVIEGNYDQFASELRRLLEKIHKKPPSTYKAP